MKNKFQGHSGAMLQCQPYYIPLYLLDWLYNLQHLVQNENMGFLSKKLLRIIKVIVEH